MDFEAEDVGDPVFLLSLDGGGIRGISEAVILHEIMKRLQEVCGLSELPKPCDHFHLIGGTSTGGLMAIMLGRLRMNTQEVIEEYERLAKRVFTKNNRRFDLSFRESALEACIKETVDSCQLGTRMLDLENEKETGSAFVVAMRKGGDENTPTLFRTYKGPGEVMDCQIWEAARATTAAPVIFKPAKVGSGNQAQTFIDGAVKWNNPSKIVLNEAKSHFGDERPLGCLVSLGTGQRPPSLDPESKGRLGMTYNIGEIKRMTADFLTDPEGPHVELMRQFEDCRNSYYRFSLPPSKELGRIRIHEYKKMSALRQATEEYLSIQYVSIAIDEVVDALKNKYKHQIPLKAACHTISPSQATYITGTSGDQKAPTSLFTGREDILEQMDKFFHHRDPASSPRRDFWLWGIGGAGKTQIALRFMTQSKDRFDHIFWIDASSKYTILQSIQKITTSIFAGQNGPVNPNSVRSWLQASSKSWLIVVDNYDSGDISPYLPNTGRGNVLFTSRHRGLPPKGPCISEANVAEMSVKDSIKLLILSAHLDYESEEVRAEAERLVLELGSLPLALDQAGSYINNKGCSIAEYQTKLRLRKKELFENPLYRGAAFSNKGVYASFEATIDYFVTMSRGNTSLASGFRCALQLLNIFCFYHNEGILMDVLHLASYYLHQHGRYWEIKPVLHAIREVPSEQGSSDSPTATKSSFIGICEDGDFDVVFLARGLLILQNFALIRHDLDWERPTISMHNLVHSWARDRMTPNTFKIYHQVARSILFGSVFTPGHAIQSRMYPRLIPHMRAVQAYGMEYHDDIDFPRKSEMDRKFATALNRAGQWEECVVVLDRILEERIYEFGRDDARTLEVMLQLGRLYIALARWDKALITLLEASERLEVACDPADAKIAHRRVSLDIATLYLYHMVFPPAHGIVDLVLKWVSDDSVGYLNAKQRLSLIYQYELKWEEAEIVAEEVYEGRMKRNPRSYAALRALRELCFIRIQLGRASAMERPLTQLAEEFEATYGSAHIEALFARSDLGWAYFKQGKFKEAQETQAKVLATARATLGDRSMFTPTIIFRLGLTTAKLGDTRRARVLMEECNAWRQRVLSMDHFVTLGTAAWLVTILDELNREGWTRFPHLKPTKEEEEKAKIWEEKVGIYRPYAELPYTFAF